MSPERLTPIKRVLRHRTSEQYYAGKDTWVSSVDQARDFDSIWQVVEEITRYGIRGCCYLVLLFDSREFDVVLTV